MDIKLSIKDKDLNKEIKKLADGHLKSIVRSEILGIVKTELDKKISHYDKSAIESKFNDRIDREVKNAIRPMGYRSNGIVGTEIKVQIKQLVKEELKRHISDISEIASEQVKRQLKEVLSK